MNEKTRVRFCPSPTGMPHVGNIRTALFNYVFAKHTGGDFVFRVEDTDKERSTKESLDAIIFALKWLGLEWDEGPVIGGKFGPYFQSERTDIYKSIILKLEKSDLVYESFSTPEEVEKRHIDAGRNPKLGYDNFDRNLTTEQKNKFLAEGRKPVLRVRMPEETITWDDLVRGKISFDASAIPDFAITRANGDPLYTLVNPIDDALMEITHVLRGEDILSSTPRQIVLYKALMKIGVTSFIPKFGHLPFVMGEGNKKLSKRDPESNFMFHVDRGEIPEGLINYLALLGWSISPDEDIFSIKEMIEKFEISKVNSNPAKYDQKKSDAINAEHIRLLTLDEFSKKLGTYLSQKGFLNSDEIKEEKFVKLAELIQTRIVVLEDAWPLIEFAYKADSEMEIDENLAKKFFIQDAKLVLEKSIEILKNMKSWTSQDIASILKLELIEKDAGKPRFVFGVLRVATTGVKISPPLFESMEILGKESVLKRLAQIEI